MDPDPEFLKSFTHKTRLDRFIPFALAAREFPKPSEAVLQMTLSNQEFSVLVNDRTSHLKSFRHFGSDKRVGIANGMILAILMVIARLCLKIPGLGD